MRPSGPTQTAVGFLSPSTSGFGSGPFAVAALIENIYRSIARQLPKGYIPSTGTRSYVVITDEAEKPDQAPKSDVSGSASPRSKSPPKKKGGGFLAEFPGSIPMQAFVAEPFRETFVEIYLHGEERILITCIEILSPAN